MAKNDAFIIDAIIDERMVASIPNNDRGTVFEYFAVEQIMKNYSISEDELINGFVDGSNDGGIDAIFIFVNGHLINDVENFLFPKSNAELEIFILTCKHHETFTQAPLDNLTATLTELLDFGIQQADLIGSYNSQLIKARNQLITAYKKTASKLTEFTVRVCYASRGNTKSIGESVLSRSAQVQAVVQHSFDACNSIFDFYGSSELIELSRKIPKFSLELHYDKLLSQGEQYVVLASLQDYSNFITDEQGKLRRYLFDSNVRDFMGINGVNQEIKKTLQNITSPNFWWLNNGVTILSTRAFAIGNTLHINDVQIVNGLQTTESIYKAFQAGLIDSNNRAVLVKIIVSADAAVRDEIIQATNNQTNVEISALHATDKIQRDIEAVLLKENWFYERRTNHYTNEGVHASRLVTPLYLAAGVMNLIHKKPIPASTLKSKFMRIPVQYNKVFSDEIPIETWVNVAACLKLTDEILESFRPSWYGTNVKFLKNWRQAVSLITVARLLGTYAFTAKDLNQAIKGSYDKDEVLITWRFIMAELDEARNKTFSNRKTQTAATKLFQIAAIKYNIKALSALNIGNMESKEPFEPNEELLNNVRKLLPPQPWAKNLHLEVCKKLNIRNKVFSACITKLAQKGEIYIQRNGELFDLEGNPVTPANNNIPQTEKNSI